MKKNSLTIIFILLLFICSSCRKNSEQQLPLITTISVSNITDNSAKCGGVIYAEGSGKVTERGLCWSNSPEPTVNNNRVICGEGEGNFTGQINGLDFKKRYHVRAYAISHLGTVYGKSMEFNTLDTLPRIPIPTVKTLNIISLSQNSLSCGGSILSGLTNVTSCGICWNTVPLPTINDDKIILPAPVTNYTNDITGLNSNITYYLRAFATNSAGTGYGNQITIKTFNSTLTDIDGNIYNTIIIGDQEWMVENLKVTKYRNGSDIQFVSDPTVWTSLSSGAFCWYNNSPVNPVFYGMLYNWYAVNDFRNIAPQGWHVPTELEFANLISYLGGDFLAPKKMKETGTSHWIGTNDATNESGFSARPAGMRYNNGIFQSLNSQTRFWTTTQYDAFSAYYRYLYNSGSPATGSMAFDMRCGLSVRCVKD